MKLSHLFLAAGLFAAPAAAQPIIIPLSPQPQRQPPPPPSPSPVPVAPPQAGTSAPASDTLQRPSANVRDDARSGDTVLRSPQGKPESTTGPPER